MNAKLLSESIGKTAMFSTEGMVFEVKILDVKTPYNRIDYLVQPVAGQGHGWKSAERVKIVTTEEKV